MRDRDGGAIDRRRGTGGVAGVNAAGEGDHALTKEATMRSPLVKWTLRIGLGSMLLLALPLFLVTVTDSSLVKAAEQADLLDGVNVS